MKIKRLIVGLVIGAVIAAVGCLLAVPKIMLKERVSPLAFKDTVETFEKAVEQAGWVVTEKVDMQKILSKADKNIPPNILFTICEPHLVSTIMNDDESMIASVIMPCTVSIYQKKDGLTYVATVNSGMTGRLFRGTASKVVAGAVNDDTTTILAFLNQKTE